MTEAERLCSRVAVIKGGELVAIGHPDELRAGSGARVEIVGDGFAETILEKLRSQTGVVEVDLLNERLVIDLAGDVDTAPLVTLLVSSGARVQEVRRGTASLEEVFLTLMNEGEE
jgi:ABC-2 type transport system ATP-binding protein